MHSFTELTLQLLVLLGTIVFATFWFLLIFAPVLAVFMLLQSYYMPASRDTSRIFSTKRAPISTLVSESVEGLTVIRSCKKDGQFRDAAFNTLDEHSRAFYALISTNRWLFVCLQLLSAFIVGTIAILAVVTPIPNPTFAAVALVNSTRIIDILSSYLRIYGFMENSMVSLERIRQFSDLDTEAPNHTNFPLDKEWPQQGRIQFRNYSTTYAAELEPVLKNVDATLQPGEKVAIVGRTGAGKSSLTLALFRIIESIEGNIIIDGVDVSNLGLIDLRSRLTILPQEPVIFDGTVRENLDPSGVMDDQKLWNALEAAQFAETIRNMELKLDAPLQSKSLSLGESQLLCLARAILRKSKVLVLDEATANVDQMTDNLVQATIRKEFKDCTVITIAHRIATVIDYDKVLVLDHGRVFEFDSPQKLLKEPTSMFYSLAKASNLVQ
jgi:ABC-type multidrug transport system fused ATPase/permease subunit